VFGSAVWAPNNPYRAYSCTGGGQLSKHVGSQPIAASSPEPRFRLLSSNIRMYCEHSGNYDCGTPIRCAEEEICRRAWFHRYPRAR